jgi:hypothetical protein
MTKPAPERAFAVFAIGYEESEMLGLFTDGWHATRLRVEKAPPFEAFSTAEECHCYRGYQVTELRDGCPVRTRYYSASNGDSKPWSEWYGVSEARKWQKLVE